jgi:hypothetical protein
MNNDLILRSRRSRRLEGWPIHCGLWPSFATRPSTAPQDEVRKRFTGFTVLRFYPSGRGMNSVSPGTGAKRPDFQSSLASSMRSRRDDTKFHQM